MKRGFLSKLYMHIRCRLAGLSFPVEDDLFRCFTSDFQGALAQSLEKDELQIVHVRLAPDRFAAFVYSIRLNRLLGEIGRQLTQDLLKIFGKGFCLDGEIAAISKDDSEKFRCSVRVFDTAEKMRPYLEDLPYLLASKNE